MSKTETQSGQTDPPPPIYSRTVLSLWGSKYPVMASLGDDWYLVAHPNGPAIATAQHGCYLGHLAACPGDEDKTVPDTIRFRAVNALMNWAQSQPTYPCSTTSKQS